MMTPLDGARTWLANHGWQVVYVEDGPDGRLNRDTVEIRTGMEPDMELLVLLHEMAHITTQDEQQTHRGYTPYDQARREVTAETAAASAAVLLGVDVREASRLYLAQFPGVEPQRNAGLVGRIVADSVKAMR